MDNIEKRITNCKNCNCELTSNDNFCKKCGAKVIRGRITLKKLFSNLILALGWDSNFFITLRHLLYRPQTVFKEYIKGTRKRYANPFSFFAITIAISLFIFSKYSKQLIQMSTSLNLQETELVESKPIGSVKQNKNTYLFGYKNEKEFKEGVAKFQLKYYNLLSFLLLPFYTLIAFFVFRKPYNYGEHLVINTYIQSFTMFFGVLLFIVSLLSGLNLYGVGITIFAFVYYSFAYKKMYRLTFRKLLIKILKFIGILLVFTVITSIITIILMVIKN